MIPVPFKYRLLGDKTLALHRTQVNCAVDCSDPAGWTTAPRAPYGRDFYYDENGNLTVDKDKGIAMGNNRGLHFFYDERNLPVQIGEFHYRYTGDGQRYYKEVNGTEEYYVMDGDLTLGVFANEGSGFELQHWNIVGLGVEGRYVPGSGNYFYHKDHLGSTRAVTNATGTVLDAFDYYPFGLEMPGRSVTSTADTKEMFTGHERDHEVGLDYMVARRYNPALGRFLSIDPMADSYSSWSPYSYVLNNPIILIDPTGMCASDPGPGGPPECVGKDVVEPIQVMDFSMSLDFTVLIGLIQDLANQVVEGLENTIEKVDKAAEVSSGVELGLAGANIAAGGSLTKGVLATTATTSILDLTSAGLEFAKAELTDQDHTKALDKTASAFLGPLVSYGSAQGAKNVGARAFKKVENPRGASHRSSSTGKFVANAHVIAATSTGPAALGVALSKILFK